MGFNIGFKDIIDIFLVAVLLYQTYKLLKKTGALDVFIGVFAFIVLWYLVSNVFKMELLGSIFSYLTNVGPFVLVVLFQGEIRRFFLDLGSRKKWRYFLIFKNFFRNKKTGENDSTSNLAQVIQATRNMARTKTGALIILQQENKLDLYIQSGERIDSNVNARLIENIFFKNSPLHDGAMIITDKKIIAAGCILPVSKNQSIPKGLGLRHRAAVGITEVSDAVAVVISEETGRISWSIAGEIINNVKIEALEHFLTTKFTE